MDINVHLHVWQGLNEIFLSFRAGLQRKMLLLIKEVKACLLNRKDMFRLCEVFNVDVKSLLEKIFLMKRLWKRMQTKSH